MELDGIECILLYYYLEKVRTVSISNGEERGTERQNCWAGFRDIRCPGPQLNDSIHTWSLIYKWQCQEIRQIRIEEPVIAPEFQNIEADFLAGGARKEFSFQIPSFTDKKSETKKYYQFTQDYSPRCLALPL